jgi:hypothetical protein
MATEPLMIDRLERWAFFGANLADCRVSSDSAVVDLCACTGELVERVECGDARVIESCEPAVATWIREPEDALTDPPAAWSGGARRRRPKGMDHRTFLGAVERIRRRPTGRLNRRTSCEQMQRRASGEAQGSASVDR